MFDTAPWHCLKTSTNPSGGAPPIGVDGDRVDWRVTMVDRKPAVPGGAHLERRSALKKRIASLRTAPRLLLVEDTDKDARILETTLRLNFGDAFSLRTCRLVRDLKAAAAGPLDLVVLDDIMDGGAKAEATVPILRAAGFSGPIIVVSQMMTFTRQALLRRLGIVHALLKDEADATRLAELILDALDAPQPAG
jgi:CheY-like chemotaxis protein